MNSEQSTDSDDHKARFCAPIDFGLWHLTTDGETTLCGEYDVEGHHISGKFNVNKPRRDCTKCYRLYRTRQTKTNYKDH